MSTIFHFGYNLWLLLIEKSLHIIGIYPSANISSQTLSAALGNVPVNSLCARSAAWWEELNRLGTGRVLVLQVDLWGCWMILDGAVQVLPRALVRRVIIPVTTQRWWLLSNACMMMWLDSVSISLVESHRQHWMKSGFLLLSPSILHPIITLNWFQSPQDIPIKTSTCAALLLSPNIMPTWNGVVSLLPLEDLTTFTSIQCPPPPEATYGIIFPSTRIATETVSNLKQHTLPFNPS